MIEKTLAIIKPDAYRRRITGKIIDIIEKNDFNIKYMRLCRLSRAQAEEFYAVHKGKEFYEPLVNFMTSGPCVVLVLEGENAIQRWRMLMGATDPDKALPGTIRAEFATSTRENIVHGSDSPESAEYEMNCLLRGEKEWMI